MAINKLTIIEKRYGRLSVISEVEKKKGARQVSAVCDCGVVKTYNLGALSRRRTSSCGCLNMESRLSSGSHFNTKGGEHTGAYRSWASMKQRCLDPAAENYADYGGRGISVCERWLDFEGFFADMGSRPLRKSIDRINPNGNYELSNCRWATVKQQSNNRRNNRWITHDGQSKTVSQWSSLAGIEESLIRNRIDRLGWTVERALTAITDQRRR
jgi:hypothetical protein